MGRNILDQEFYRIHVDRYIVRSQSKPDGSYYVVDRVAVSCSYANCKNLCIHNGCDATLCAHLYHCSWSDLFPLSKHIHKIHMADGKLRYKDVSKLESPPFQFVSEPKTPGVARATSREIMLNAITNNLQLIKATVDTETLSDNLIQQIHHNLKDIVGKCTGDNVAKKLQVIPVKDNFAPNQKLTKQLQLPTVHRKLKKKKKSNSVATDHARST